MSGLAARDATLCWDYTLSGIERIASTVAGYTSPKTNMDSEERRAAAYHGVAERLYAAQDRPSRDDLFWAGVNAVYAEVRSIRKMWGQPEPTTEYHDPGTGPRFVRYWSEHTTPFPEDGICERVALPQVLASLTGAQYEVLIAFAVLGTQRQVAEHFGCSMATVSARLSEARQVIYRLWFEGQTPPRRSHSSANTCRSGHPWDKFGKVTRGGTERYCAECRRQYKRRRRAKGERP